MVKKKGHPQRGWPRPPLGLSDLFKNDARFSLVRVAQVVLFEAKAFCRN